MKKSCIIFFLEGGSSNATCLTEEGILLTLACRLSFNEYYG